METIRIISQLPIQAPRELVRASQERNVQTLSAEIKPTLCAYTVVSNSHSGPMARHRPMPASRTASWATTQTASISRQLQNEGG
jgi:hypothetical protein